MYEKITSPCKGVAFDFISLDPSITVFGEFLIGHPEILPHNFGDATNCFGMILCRILPPNNLWIPTLPLRLADGRTVYSLCRSCSENLNLAKPCKHSDDERTFEGAWVTSLLNQALSDGYKILDIFEVHHFPQRSAYDPATNSGGIFAEVILALMRKTIVSSGFPSTISTDAEKQEYCRNYRRDLGMVFTPDGLTDNLGARYAEKIVANATWRRYS